MVNKTWFVKAFNDILSWLTHPLPLICVFRSYRHLVAVPVTATSLSLRDGAAGEPQLLSHQHCIGGFAHMVESIEFRKIGQNRAFLKIVLTKLDSTLPM